MARIRTVKPEVHLDEDLWDLEVETGLPIFRAFVGLWNHADREGRFEWRPRALKAGILPYWNGDFSRVLDALATRGFVAKYASGARTCGVVRTFKIHQHINNREPASVLPEPPDNIWDSTRPPRVLDASSTRQVHAPEEGKGREGKGINNHDASPSDLDSWRAPDLSRMDSGAYLRHQYRELLTKSGRFENPSRPQAEAMAALAQWASGALDHPQVDKLLRRFFACPHAEGANFAQAFLRMHAAAYLTGQPIRTAPPPEPEDEPVEQLDDL